MSQYLDHLKANRASVASLAAAFNLSTPDAVKALISATRELFETEVMPILLVDAWNDALKVHPRPKKYVFFLKQSHKRMKAWHEKIDPVFLADPRVVAFEGQVNYACDVIDTDDVVFCAREAFLGIHRPVMEVLKKHDLFGDLFGIVRFKIPAMKRVEEQLTKRQSVFEAGHTYGIRRMSDPGQQEKRDPWYLRAVWKVWGPIIQSFYSARHMVKEWSRP